MLRKHIQSIALTGFICSLHIGTALAADHIGTATYTNGTVLVERESQTAPTALNTGDMIYLGDTVLTDAGDHAKITFIDETTIALNGADGSLTIDDYIYDPEAPKENRARFNVLQASFVYVSGALGKVKKPDVQIELDFGTIGIRGTKILRSMKDQECWIYVEEGAIRVSNDGGIVNLKTGGGTRISSTKTVPSSPKPWSAENIAWVKGAVALPTDAVDEKAEDPTDVEMETTEPQTIEEPVAPEILEIPKAPEAPETPKALDE